MPLHVRESIYGWMNHWLRDGPPGPVKEQLFQTEYEQDMYATRTRAGVTSLGGETCQHREHTTLQSYAAPEWAPEQSGGGRNRAHPLRADARYSRVPQGTAKTTRRLSFHGHVARLANSRQLYAVLLEPDAAHSLRKTVLYLDDRGAAQATRARGDAQTFGSEDTQSRRSTCQDWARRRRNGRVTPPLVRFGQTTWLAPHGWQTDRGIHGRYRVGSTFLNRTSFSLTDAPSATRQERGLLRYYTRA